MIEKEQLKCIMISNYGYLNNVQFAQKCVVPGMCLREFHMLWNVLSVHENEQNNLKVSHLILKTKG